ncbi:MAG: ParB N-terminal domain-containing protein [Deltaproteobacteria bacterium]|nr:ParB N-terminal domain-containing protein [Deltaproteobacteria bacterium]
MPQNPLNHPTDIFPRIAVVPCRRCVAHEGIVPQWVDQIATNIRDRGVMKNPIIVTRPMASASHKHIVIDGMHRFAAFQRLGIADIVVYQVDYADPTIRLEGWDALLFRPFRARRFLQRRFPAAKGYRIASVTEAETAQAMIDAREAVVAAADARGAIHVVRPARRSVTVDAIIRACEDVDLALDAEGLRPVYVADTLAWEDFAAAKAHGIVMRPHYTKDEILERTVARRLFPRKSTRHLIPGRPLRVDVPLTILRAAIPLAAKNRLLNEHLRWCYAADRIRYYPESVFVFSD